MCCLASEISALAAECSRFALAQDEGNREQEGKRAEGETARGGLGLTGGLGGGGCRGSGVKEQA